MLLTRPAPRPLHLGWVILAVAVTFLRLIECALPPAITGDLGRHLLTANLVNAKGWAAAAMPVAAWAPAASAHASWTEIPYNYPPLALWFFQAVAWVHASLFAAKFALTLIEAVNAWLLARISGDVRFGLVYWCLPLSIWWVSREGQFEPVQSLFVLLALLFLKNERFEFAPAALALAVQTKLSAVFIAPWIAFRVWRQTSGPRFRVVAFLLLAVVPTVGSLLAYPILKQVWFTMIWPAHSNVYNWRALFSSGYRWWLPLPFVIVTFVTSFLLLLWTARCSLRDERGPMIWLAPLLFLVATKFMGVFQGWYFIGFVPLWLPAVPPRERLKWLLFTQLCEPLSVWELFFGPTGPCSPQVGVDVFSRCWHP